MSESDRQRWDVRHAAATHPTIVPVGPPVFASFEHFFPTRGRALELACGCGGASLWLASRGMRVRGVDVSPVAIDRARALLAASPHGDRARFDVFDLDAGLPSGPPVDLLLCCFFRDPRLYPAMIERIAPAGLLAIATLSEVDAAPSPHRARPGELQQAFARLDTLACGERDGHAWFIGRRG